MKLFCFFILFVAIAVGQNLLPFNQSVYVADQPVFVSPCGVAVVSFRVTAPPDPRFFFTMTLNAITSVPWKMTISQKGPSSTSAEDYKSCSNPAPCNTSSTCFIVQGCGDQDKQWYAYVETIGLDAGSFSLRLETIAYPVAKVVTIDDNPGVQNNTLYTGGSLGAGGTSLSQYDFYTFTLASRPPGTVMDIDIKTRNGPPNVNNYLFFQGIVNPLAGCVYGGVNLKRLAACDVANGGTWSLAVERTAANQQYTMRLYYTNGINANLVENVPTPGEILQAGDEIYFRYQVPANAGSTVTTQQQQIYFVLDSVVGGVVEIKPLFNQAAGTQCAGGRTCKSIEGCHVVIPNCEVTNARGGFYTVVAKAISVIQNKYIPVTFNLRGYLKIIDLVPNTVPAGTDLRRSLFLSEYAAFKYTLPTTINIGDWLDLELYVDADQLDFVPATMFIGTAPFPQNSTYGCTSPFFKRCDARISFGNQKYCFLQLDPCELEQFTAGVYVTVFSNNQARPVTLDQEHTQLQNPMDFTIYTDVRNPNDNRINHGTVITDEVTEGWKRAYRLDDTIRRGDLEIAISANYHFVFPIGNSLVIANDTARIEIDVDIIYAQSPYIGPSCLTCYRVQQSYHLSLRALETQIIEHRKCVQGFEHVYLVITGNNTLSRVNTTSQFFNFSDNRYVITAKDLTPVVVENIKPTEFSNIISQESAFGGLQFWNLDFNRALLFDNTLHLRLRAHPRSGRKMTLFIVDDFDPNCADPNNIPFCGGTDPGLSFECNVNDTNKGYCYIAIQECVLIPQMNRTFVVRVESFNRPNLTASDVAVEFAYSFQYDLIPSVAKEVRLGKDTQIIVDVEAEIYQHFKVNLPAASVGRDTFIIEAYFDSNNLYATKRPLTIYVNQPDSSRNGVVLAGLPLHSAQCLCFTQTASDINKVVMIFDRCDLQSGFYYFSLFTDAHGFREGKSHVTVRAYTVPFIQPINYEVHSDLSLFLGQSAAYQITVDNGMLTDNTRTDKELQIWVNTNLDQYNATIDIRLSNSVPTCGCGVAFGDVSYPCAINFEDGRRTQNGRCDIITGMCNLAARNWFIITRVVQPSALNPVDPHQVVPFTLTATKANTIPVLVPLVLRVSPTCSFLDRTAVLKTIPLKTEEYVFFDVRNQNTVGFSAYFDNITGGFLEVFAASGFLPTINCTVLTQVCPETPIGGGPPCIVNLPGGACSNIEYIAVKAVSNDRNQLTTFQVSDCLINISGSPNPAARLNFNDRNGIVVQVAASQPVILTFPAALNSGQTPYVIISIQSQNLGGGDNYRATFGRGGCTSCAGGLSRTCTNNGRNCTMYILFCDLPGDYQTGTWQITITNSAGATGFFVEAFSVNNNVGQVPLTTNPASPLSYNVGPLQWVNLVWNLGSPDILPIGTAVQADSIVFSPNSATLIKHFNDGVTCIAPFTNNTFNFSTCCAQASIRVYSFFQQDFVNTAVIQVTPTLQTFTQNHTRYAWGSGLNSVTQTVSASGPQNGQTVLAEYYTVYPGVTTYGSYIFQANVPSGVNIYLQRVFVAGPNTGKNLCLSNEVQPPNSGGLVLYAQMACATSTIPLSKTSPDPFFPQGIYAGFENTNSGIATGTFNYTLIRPIEIFNNSISAVTAGWRTANQQFFYQPGPNHGYLRRIFRIRVDVQSGTVTMYVNRKIAAGPVTNCTGAVLTSAPTSSSATLDLATCAVASPPTNDLVWIGIIPQTDNALFRVTITEINQLIEANTPAQNLVPFAPFLANGGNNNFDVSFANIPALSYLKVSITNITFGSTYAINIYRDGKCQNFNTAGFGTFCGEPTNFGYKCTNILPGCQLENNVIYHIEITGGTPYTIVAEIVTFSLGGGANAVINVPPPIGRPGEVLSSRLTGAINPHDLALYRVPIPPRSVLPGERISVTLESTDCGTVDAWGYVGGLPGPWCNTANNFCGSANCEITHLEQCQTFSSSTATPAAAGKFNFATDLWVLMRGKVHTETNNAMRFTLRVDRRGSYDVRHFYYLEKHHILPVAPTPPSVVNPVTCPASSVPSPRACCPAAAATSGSWIWQPTVFHFPVEGAHFLNDLLFQRLHLSIDNRFSPFIQSAELKLWNQQPSFCGGIDFPNRVVNEGQFTRCTVTQAAPNCTVNMYIPVCGLVDSHLMFFTVENIVFTPGNLPLTIAGFKDGLSVTHTRIPNTIRGINYNTSKQYFEGDLLKDQSHYFKVFHSNAAQDNYHFTVQVLSVVGGSVDLDHHWTGCPNTTVCTSTNCADVDPRQVNQSENCKTLPDCSCNYEHIACRTGDMNSAPVKEGFFAMVGANIQAGFDVVHYVIVVEFIEPVATVTNVVCGNETCEEERYYKEPNKASQEQLYRYRLASVNGKSNILIANDGQVGLDGYPNPVQGPSCQKRRVCDSLVDGVLDECVTFYRTVEDLLPYVSVHRTGQCLDHALTRFNLSPDRYTPPIFTLTDGAIHDSQFFLTAGGCSAVNQTYWYRIDLNAGQYMVVELWGASAERMQLWVTKDHISYSTFGELLNIGCQTVAGGPLTGGRQYCRYVKACGYTTGRYYIQVSDSSPLPKDHALFRHQIRVTSRTPRDIPLTFGQDTTFFLGDDLRDITTITVSGVSGNQLQPYADMTLYWSSEQILSSWLTRNLFGDATCSVDGDVEINNAHKLKLRECLVDNSGGVFKAHFMLSPRTSCVGSRVISFATRFNLPGVAVLPAVNAVNTPVSMTMRPGSTIYIKHTLPAPLQANDIVYSRLSGYDQNTRLTTTIWRGNHLDTNRNTYALPCNAACTEGTKEVSTNVAWGDVCWHCGNGVYNTIFEQVDATPYTGNTSLLNQVNFLSTLSVVQPTALTPTAVPISHPAEEHSLRFFSVPYARNQGSRIELVIAKGGAIGVEINVYASDCGLRTNPSQYWCFPGHHCSLPVPEIHNFGSFYTFTDRTSPYISPNMLVVVRAVDASYTISNVRGTASCNQVTAAAAPFCGSLNSITTGRQFGFWGNTNTFKQKDEAAREFYYNLTIAFSCPNEGVDHCRCNPLSVPCRNFLAIYACLSIFNPCDSNGLETQPVKLDCDNVENSCPKTFRCAGYPERECGASFYYVPPAPTRAPTTNASRAPSRAPTTRPSSAPTNIQPANLPPSFIVNPTDASPTNDAQGPWPEWVPGVVIFLIVLVAILLVAVVVGGVIMAAGGGAAAQPTEIDAYQRL